MSAQEESPPVAAGLTWRRVAVSAAFAIPVLFILNMLLIREFIPFLLIFCVVFAALGFWASRGGRASLIVLGVISVIFIVMNLPFIIPTLSVPASVVDFSATALILISAITIAVAAFIAFRGEGAPSPGARTFSRAVGGVAVLVVLVSVISGVTYEDASQQEGDIAMTTEDIEFEPETIDADSGTVAVYITNNDPTLHTFTIDELDVNLDIPSNSTARIEFEAESGEYEFYCRPHEDVMEGTLQVQ